MSLLRGVIDSHKVTFFVKMKYQESPYLILRCFARSFWRICKKNKRHSTTYISLFNLMIIHNQKQSPKIRNTHDNI